MKEEPGSGTTYDVAGRDGAPPIVFVHGVRADRHQWAPQMESLSGEYRLVSMDLPGHGVRKADRFSLGGAAEDIARVIEEAAGGRALVVGLSLGGYSAMELVSQHPEKVSGLALVSCSLNPHPLLAFSNGLTRFMLKSKRRSALANSSGQLLRRLFPQRVARFLASSGLRLKSNPAGTEEIMGVDFTERISDYPGPVLFINGIEDMPFRAEESKFLNAAKNGSIEVIDCAGHTPNLDQPAAFTKVLREFATSAFS